MSTDNELMIDYIGTKRIKSRLMTLGEYNEYRGWETPGDQDGSAEGCLVEYTDGGKPNHPDHKGYISWSPKAQHEKAYQQSGSMTFGHAIEMMKAGFKVSRTGWNGKGMFVVRMPELYLASYNTQVQQAKVNDRTAGFIGKDTPINCQAYFAMYTASGDWQPGWLASQEDMLAEDWCVIPSSECSDENPCTPCFADDGECTGK